jgi:hypothetical protein
MRRMPFQCRSCGERHDELPMAFHADEPRDWAMIPEAERDTRGLLGSDQCELDEQRFMRGLIRVPVENVEDPLEWGVWFELSRQSYDRFASQWTTEGREREPLHDGALATQLPLYPDTIGVPVKIRTRPVGERPLVEVQGAHPLALEQKHGISKARLEELWAFLLHQD